MNLPLIASIDALLPQTQCGQCGYAGCKPYASAISTNDASINQCPPGGDAVIHQLANLLDVPYLPLNPRHGEHKAKLLAVIDEPACIGCTLCIAACPVDAIIGAFKFMHSVIAVECTGCELCIAPCPVDCISLIPAPVGTAVATTKNAANLARERYEHRQLRHTRQKSARLQKRQSSGSLVPGSEVVHADSSVDIQYKGMASLDVKKAAMMAALAKVVLLKKNPISKKTHETTVLQQNTNMAQLPAVDQE